ncbi:hypothetical protein FM104_14805 [Microbacterium esteraromaticum]|uniref:Uncharacterized protein n=1 Tax=Microbacterium esteraromaticum TaxID=57043 RepID=A0A1R4KPV3_9MICO|nr:hypothetical protein FM104_14805 [Microbacterium esteraromaticum]
MWECVSRKVTLRFLIVGCRRSGVRAGRMLRCAALDQCA